MDKSTKISATAINGHSVQEKQTCKCCGSNQTHIKGKEQICETCSHVYRIDGPFSPTNGSRALTVYVDGQLERYAMFGIGVSIRDYTLILIASNVFSVADYPAALEYVRKRIDAQPMLGRRLTRNVVFPADIWEKVEHEAHVEKRGEGMYGGLNIVKRALELYFALPIEERMADMFRWGEVA